MQKAEKSVQIDGVGKPRQRTGRYSNRPEEIRAGLRKAAGDLTNLENTFRVDFITVAIRTFRHNDHASLADARPYIRFPVKLFVKLWFSE